MYFHVDVYLGSKDNPYPAVSTKHTDPATQKKIEQILADAQKQQIAAAVAAAANMVTSTIPSEHEVLSVSVISRNPKHHYHHAVLNLMILRIRSNRKRHLHQQLRLLPILL